jgi:hypothetical protein
VSDFVDLAKEALGVARDQGLAAFAIFCLGATIVLSIPHLSKAWVEDRENKRKSMREDAKLRDEIARKRAALDARKAGKRK